MWDVGRSASTDVLSGTSSLVVAPDEVFGTHKVTDIEIEPINEGLPLRDGDDIMRFELPGLSEDLYPYVTPNVPVRIGPDHPLCEGLDFQSAMNAINRDVLTVMELFELLFPA
jgi:hypothetical protein